ncbi:MAG: cellulase family glycosylhydrolase [Candidatus Dormibacteria bacterium]
MFTLRGARERRRFLSVGSRVALVTSVTAALLGAPSSQPVGTRSPLAEASRPAPLTPALPAPSPPWTPAPATPSPSPAAASPAPSASPSSAAASTPAPWSGSSSSAPPRPTVAPATPAPTQPAPAAPSNFVRASGTNLTLNGRPWQFTGYDDYRLASSSPGYQCGGPLSDADVAASLDEIQNVSGANVVRVWFMQSYGGPGNWGQFDRVLNAAAARGMKVIPVLTDQWAACEPWPAGQTKYRTLAWYRSGYRAPDPGYTLSYRNFAAAMAAHYAGSTAIAFWQLVNEAEAMTAWGGACDESAAVAALRSFADDVTGVIKANDPNHLVSLGTIGTGQCGASSNEDYTYIHAGAVDLCEYHDYFGPGAVPGDQWHGIGVRINDCHSLNKPIFAGEVGIQASIAPDGSTSGAVTPSSLSLRATYFQQKLAGQFGAGVVGFLIWQYATGPRTDGYEVQPGDPTEGVMRQFSRALSE